jgi:hypothetical protein
MWSTSSMKPTGYMCALCGEGIGSHGLDITALVLITNWDGPEDRQQSQQFFAHFECLAKSFLPEVSRQLDHLRDDRED